MAKVIVDISDEMWNTLQIGQYQMGYAEYVAQYVEKGKLIPNNATNGDVIKAMFPDIDFYEGEIDKIGGLISFYAKDEHGEKRQRVIITEDWWNAPYKAGDTDGNRS